MHLCAFVTSQTRVATVTPARAHRYQDAHPWPFWLQRAAGSSGPFCLQGTQSSRTAVLRSSGPRPTRRGCAFPWDRVPIDFLHASIPWNLFSPSPPHQGSLPAHPALLEQRGCDVFLMGYVYHATTEGRDWADVHLYSTDHRSLFQAPPSPFIFRRGDGSRRPLRVRACEGAGW